MQCIYINLKNQIQRRLYLEKNFESNNQSGWRLLRLEAVDSETVQQRKIDGKLRPSEKACFLSHRSAVEKSIAFSDHTMIVEDDVLFGKSSIRLIEGAIAAVPQDAWDILFTDIGVWDVHAMIDLLFLRRTLGNGLSRVLPLKGFPFTASTSYIVNANSKTKILRLLNAVQKYDLPYDLHLRALINRSDLAAFAIFPFATSLSYLGDDSQIEPPEGAAGPAILNAFRRGNWFDRDAEDFKKQAELLGDCDGDTAAFLKIVGAMLRMWNAPHG
jgi:GR25 family glycosyltransferase involved in LPS biosynthesis